MIESVDKNVKGVNAVIFHIRRWEKFELVK